SAGWAPQQIADLLVVARQNAGEPIKHANYFARTVAKALAGTPRPQPADSAPTAETEGAAAKAASMAQVMQRSEGIRFLVQDGLPLGMVRMLFGEPGIGNSALAVYWLVRPLVTGAGWFTGAKGPAKPGPVLWCDTEGSTAITVQRIKDGGCRRA